MAAVVILSRWLHIVAACLVIGGVFFVRFVLPRGAAGLEMDQRKKLLLKTRKAFKPVIHSAIGLLIITGVYNTLGAWHAYQLEPGRLQALWGVHIVLALTVFTVLLCVLAGAEPSPRQRTFMAVTFGLLLLAVATASSLKAMREKAVENHFSVTLTADKR